MSLTIPEKTTVAIVGPSGSGKTTLCHLMARFWDVQGGRVTPGRPGRPGVQLRQPDAQLLLCVPAHLPVLRHDCQQHPVWQAGCLYGGSHCRREKARCHDFIKALPKGYDTVIGEGRASISGGERQRITIARAIMKDAPIIILDEATANVDPENEKDLVEAIQS